MNKRLFSLILCLILCLSLLPMAALAASEEAAEPETAAEPAAAPEEAEPAEEAEPTEEAEPVKEAEPTEEAEAEPEPAVSLDGEAEPSGAETARVQALLDALPDADTITAENRADVQAQLTAIDDARLALDDGAALDYTRYQAAIAALEALDGMAGASEPALLGNSAYNELQGMIDKAGENATVSLDKNYSIDQTLQINKTLTLDLKGHTLTGSIDGPVIEIGGSCTIKSSASGGKITNTKTNMTGKTAGVYVKKGASFSLGDNVTITDCKSSLWDTAGGVYVAGTFTMKGGTITKCSFEGERGAGGVRMYGNGQFNMSGGTISYCTAGGNETTQTAFRAGGVYTSKGSTFTMSGGTILGCKTTVSYSAGGVYVYDGSTFNMTGGTISACQVNFATSGDTGKTQSAVRNIAGGVINQGTFKIQGTGSAKKAQVYNCYVVTVQSSASGDPNKASALMDMYSDPRYVVGGVLNFAVLTIGSYGEITEGKVCASDQTVSNASKSDVQNLKTIYANGGRVGVLLQKSGATLTKSANAAGTTTFDNTCVNYGTISAGNFTNSAAKLHNYATISGGYFACNVMMHTEKLYGYKDLDYIDEWKGSTITGGTFTGAVQAGNRAEGITSEVNRVSGGDFSQATLINKVPYTITFNLNGASGNAPENRWCYNADCAGPDEPTWDGYRFLGWYWDTREGTEKVVFPWGKDVHFSVAQDGVVALYAKWEALLATEPAANALHYTGAAQELVSAGTLSDYARENGYTLEYKLSTESTYTAAIPQGSDAGSYTVDWRVVKDGAVVSSGSVEAAIAVGSGLAGEALELDNVTSADRASIEARLQVVNDYFAMEPSEEDVVTLNAIKAELDALMARLDAVKSAMEDETITGTDGITKDNVSIADKDALTAAKAAIETLLDDYEANLTADEKQALDDKLARIGESLDEIAQLEKAATTATPTPAPESTKAPESTAAPTAKPAQSPKTGDSATPILWIVIAVVAAAAVVVIVVMGKKKKN